MIGKLIMPATSGIVASWDIGTHTSGGSSRTYTKTVHESDYNEGCIMFVNKNFNNTISMSVKTHKTLISP